MNFLEEEMENISFFSTDFNHCRTVCDQDVCDSLEDTVRCIQDYIFPTPLEWLFICLHLGLFTIGVVGNVLVCFVVLRSKHMQTVTNLFLVNLAFADAVVLVFCSPASVLQSVTETWFLGNVMCKVVIFFQSHLTKYKYFEYRLTKYKYFEYRLTKYKYFEYRLTEYKYFEYRLTKYKYFEYRLTEYKYFEYRLTEYKYFEYRLTNLESQTGSRNLTEVRGDNQAKSSSGVGVDSGINGSSEQRCDQ
ncbi:Orexin receptor type 1 [Bulinus truncatus]|nr:Orexin receptor type 1 [Bulinus truncatus]